MISFWGNLNTFFHGVLRSKRKLLVLWVLVMVFNWAETRWMEPWLDSPERVYEAAYNFKVMEDAIPLLPAVEQVFEFHSSANKLAMLFYTVSYFGVFLGLYFAPMIKFYCLENISRFRVLCMATIINYMVCLFFFLTFPVPERWSYPGSFAVLLPDSLGELGTKLVMAIRPISGIDNCFPSMHTSLTVMIMVIFFLNKSPWRYSVATAGLTIILATFVLGIHWLWDILAGIGVGILSATWAFYWDKQISDHQPSEQKASYPEELTEPNTNLLQAVKKKPAVSN